MAFEFRIINHAQCSALHAVHCISLTDDGQYLLAAGADRAVRLFNPHRCMLIQTYPDAHAHAVYSVNASTSKRFFASAGTDPYVCIFDVQRQQPVRRVRRHDGHVHCVRFHGASEDLLLSGSQDCSVQLWDLRSREPIMQTLRDAKDTVYDVLSTPTTVYAAGADGVIREYDLRKGRITADHMIEPVTSLCITRNEKQVLASVMGDTIRLLDRQTGEMVAEYYGHKHQKYKIQSCIDHSDTLVLSGSEDGNVFCWDLVERTLKRTIAAHKGAVTSIAAHPTQSSIFTAGSDGTIKVWCDVSIAAAYSN